MARDPSVNITLSLVSRLSIDVGATFQEMIKKDVKIIIALFSPAYTKHVLCQVSCG